MNLRILARKDITEGIYPVCYLCGKEIKTQKDLTIDHIVSKHQMKQEGIRPSHNFAIAHRKCNQKKGSLPLAVYLQKRQRE